MAVYDSGGNVLVSIYDSGGTSLQTAYDSAGNIIFETSQINYLDSYSIFVPQNVSNEWDTGSPNGKTLNVSTAQFLALFYDDYLENPPTGITVTKTSIGKDQSGEYDIYQYDFMPENYERTILLSSGMHTYELGASFGLANFINNLYSSINDGNEAFQYIRQYVRIKVIPVVNPWGFDKSPKRYGNVNGVNPNRNFDMDNTWDDFTVYIPSQNVWNVKGEYPFSEKETVNLAKWAASNWAAEFWIDCHTGVGYSDCDLWLYYSSDSVYLNRINAAIGKIETWFAQTYGVQCVTKRTIDNPGMIRVTWGEHCANLPGFTLEQAPGRTTFGTANNNDSGDISNYCTNISTFVQEFLLKTYASYSVKPIVSATNPGAVSIDVSAGVYSVTIESALTPSDTTQNKFSWVSSDEAVAQVYGDANMAIVVGTGNGTATITGTNRYDNSIAITCSLTVTGYDLANAISLPADIGGIDYTDGSDVSATNRVRTGFIDVSGRTWTDALAIRDLSVSGIGNEFLIRLYDSNHDYIATLNSWSGSKDGQSWFIGNGTLYDTLTLPTVAYIRMLFRYADDRDIVSASGTFRIRNTVYTFSV